MTGGERKRSEQEKKFQFNLALTYSESPLSKN
jgi:hypothetical protein